MNALAEFVAVNGDAVPRSAGHTRVAVAGEAVLGTENEGRERENCQAGREDSAADGESRFLPCGSGHSAVFSPREME